LCIVSPFVLSFSYFRTVQGCRPLSPGGNQIAVNKYHFKSFHFTLYLCVLCGSENKQPLFPYTALTDWFV